MTTTQPTSSSQPGFFDFGETTSADELERSTGVDSGDHDGGLSAPPPPTRKRGNSNGAEESYTQNNHHHQHDRSQPHPLEEELEDNPHKQHYGGNGGFDAEEDQGRYEDVEYHEQGYGSQTMSYQGEDKEPRSCFQQLEQDEYRHHQPEPRQQRQREEEHDEEHRFAKPTTNKPSPASKFAKVAPPPPQRDTDTMSTHSQSSNHYSRPSDARHQSFEEQATYEAHDDQMYSQHSQHLQHPLPVLDRNAHSFDDLSHPPPPPARSPGRHFAQPASDTQLRQTYNEHQRKNRNSQEMASQESPIHNYSKPVPIPTRPYDSSSSQQQQSSSSQSFAGGQLSSSFRQQQELSSSHHSSNIFGGHSPNNPPPMPQSYSSQFGAPEPSHFPSGLSTSPQAAPNQTPAFPTSQPFQPPPPIGTHPGLYSNHREAQPAQHAGGEFPQGWAQNGESDETMGYESKSSTNPFSPDIQNSQPYGQPATQQQQQHISSSPSGYGDLRALQEGSIGEGRAYSIRSNGSNKSPAESSEKPSAIGRPTPPTQPSSQQSHHSHTTHVSHVSHMSQQTHVSQQSQARGGGGGSGGGGGYGSYLETALLSNASPQSNMSGYSHGPPPAIPPKKPLDETDREREREQQQQEQIQRAEREQRAAAFSYQQHLQRHLANASTSPHGMTGYGPPPLPIGQHKRDTAPRVTSPLSIRKNEPSSFRPPQLQQSKPRQQSEEDVSQQQQQSPQQQERKVSFGQGSDSGQSPKQRGRGQGQSSPQDRSQRSSQYNGSPHGSQTGSTGPRQPYSPPRKYQGTEQSPPAAVTDSPPQNPQTQPQRFTMPPLLTPVSDGPAPPPAPSCPPPDTPVSELGGQRGPPGGFLKSIAGGSGTAGYKNYMGLPLMGGKSLGDSREQNDGGSGTPTGFLTGKTVRKPDQKGPPPLGARPRGGSSGSSGLGRMERPGSAEGDDPIPPEYRPRGGDKTEEPPRREKNAGVGLGLEGQPQQQQSTVNPAQQMQQLRRPPVVAQRPSEKFVKSPPQPGSQQRSPAEVGLGGYLYSKPVPPPSVGNSGTSNPRFPSGSITSPLTNATSPPGNIGTRESVMRGQWVDDTAAVSGPAPPVRKPDPHQMPPQPVYGGYDGPSLVAESGYKAYTQAFSQQPQSSVPSTSPPEVPINEDVDENVTNPSESPTPDIPHISQHHSHSKRASGSQEALFATFSDLLPSLPPSHVSALLNFAMYLTEDAIVADKAENLKLSSFKTASTKEQLNLLGDQRLRLFREWARVEEDSRRRQVVLMKAPPPELKEHPFHGGNKHQDSVGYEGMQPLPPPPSLGALDEFGGDKYHHHKHHSHGQRQGSHGYVMPDLSDHYRENSTPSPTPTVDQVAAAPKVELELQMPRPMPSVPAIRIDPSTRRKFEDDASTVASISRAENRENMGLPGGTPYPFPFPKRQDYEFEENRPVDTKTLSAVILSFTKAKGKDDGEIMADIPPFLHMAYAALDKATNQAPVDQYLENARKLLEQKTQNRINVFQQNAMKRAQLNQSHTNAAYNSGRFTFADIERMREQFEQEEAKNKMELDSEIYMIFENEYVEVAYKEVKTQLEELGGRWYEEVKNWLFTVTAQDTRGTGTALEYHLLLEAIDLLNKLHVTMEEHEHVLQSLVTERNARYLQISVGPLLQAGETVRAADAERRYWIDEQERQIRSKIERGKRVAEHRVCVDRVGEQVVEGLRKRYGEVLEAVWGVVWQFPPSIQPTLLRKFFDENTLPIPQSESPTTYTVAQENVKALAEAVSTLGEIVALIKLAMDFRSAPMVRVIEAQLAIQVAEEHARANGVTAPAATAAACAKGVKQRLPAALKRVGEECRAESENVVGGLMEVLERLRIGVEELALKGGRVDVGLHQQRKEWNQSVIGGGVGVPIGDNVWQQGSGESWVTASAGYTPAPPQPNQGVRLPQQHQQVPQQGALSVSTMLGGFRRSGNPNSFLVSPGGYSPSGFSPAGFSSISGSAPWGVPVSSVAGSEKGHGGSQGSAGY